MAVPADQVGAGIDLTGRHDELADRTRLVGYELAHHAAVDALLDDHVVLITELGGGHRTAGGGRHDLGAVPFAVAAWKSQWRRLASGRIRFGTPSAGSEW